MKMMDEGHGITVKSLKFWRENKHQLGKVHHVTAATLALERRPITTEENRIIMADYHVEITGTDGAMLLSGCGCGYGGEGPNGTKSILVELGVPEDIAEKLTHNDGFVKVIQ